MDEVGRSGHHGASVQNVEENDNFDDSENAEVGSSEEVDLNFDKTENELKEQQDGISTQDEEKIVENIIPLKEQYEQEIRELKNANEQEIKGLKDTILRLKAEEINFKKLSESRTEEAIKYSNSKFIKELVNVSEYLYMALNSTEQNILATNKELNNLYQGVKITYDELLKVFNNHKVKRIYALGELFDPNIHQAVTHEESDEKPGVIIEVVKAGYMLDNRLIFPSLVKVAKAKEK